MRRRFNVADGIKAGKQLIVERKMAWDCIGQPRGLKNQRMREKKRYSVRYDWGRRPELYNVKMTETIVVGFEDRGRGPGGKKCRRALEAGRGREMECPPVSPKRNMALPKPCFLPSDTRVRVLHSRTVR